MPRVAMVTASAPRATPEWLAVRERYREKQRSVERPFRRIQGTPPSSGSESL